MTSLRFTSHVRPAVGARLGAPPAGEVRHRLTSALTLTATPQDTAEVTGPELSVVGPESVIGVDPGLFGRRTPAPGVTDAVANDLVSVDVSAVDLPWRFTARAADEQGRLRPWMVLVVVEASTGRLQPGAPLPVLLTRRRELPDLSESWAWAHVQSAVADPADAGAVPGSDIARLVCPRRLTAGRPYIAAVVPAFGAGVAVGTGADVDPETASGPAWTVAAPGDGPDDPVKLPVYLTWQFSTGPEGDFEQLVSRIAPLEGEAAEGFGSRPVDVSAPWPDEQPDPARAGAVLHVQGALRDISASGETPAPPESADLREALADAVDAGAPAVPAGGRGPARPGALAPPLYGGPHAGRETVDRTPGAEDQDWLSALNLDVRHRIAAGLGAEFVRRNQEELMAYAWEFAGALREANRDRAHGRLSERVAASAHRRHVATLTSAELVALSAPAQHRVRSVRRAQLSVTAGAELHVSRLADGFAGTAFARLTRPSGPVARRAVAPAGAFPGSDEHMPRNVPRPIGLARALTDASAIRGLAGAVSVPVAADVLQEVPPPPAQPVAGLVSLQVQAVSAAEDRLRATRSLTSLEVVRLVAEANGYTAPAATIDSGLDGLPFRASLRAADASEAVSALVDTGTAAMAAGSLRTTLASLTDRSASDEQGHLLLHQGCGPDVGGAGVRVDAEGFRQRLVDGMNPDGLVGARLAQRVALPSGLGDPHSTEDLTRAPDFPAPLAMALLADAPDWFLPGLSAFPTDRVRLVAANAPFIEAYLIGLNHEMNRELLWREYPSHRRATTFRMFWPHPDGAQDLPQIALFAGGPLGSHLSADAGELVILLVRAELLRRYPRTLLFMVPARAADDGSPAGLEPDTTRWSPPVFALPVDAATTAYAFRGSPSEIVGPPGAYFVFQEHAYQMRFGFDLDEAPLNSWNDLSWPLVADARGFASVNRAIASPAGSDLAWGADAAQTAAIALQRPVRVARHASELVAP
ncbi:hypothetical protein [Streptomyces hilarionis]|uniref:hypothetical protein n=1 Tax=Streptomyces hilarionis TaxID=2839954 RepID=UPI002119E5D5|nr:hypothetical protein [Streptomyces hilarionis]MCQ9131155.1 hypothetical protein [Streptomyces hilarionis]